MIFLLYSRLVRLIDKRINQMKLASFKTNLVAAEEGTWVDVGDGFRIKLARSGNSKAQDLLEKLLKPHRFALQNNTIHIDVLKEINNKVLAQTVVLGWDGLIDDEGKPVPFSPSIAYDLLQNPQYRDFRDMVQKLADEPELFRNEAVADIGKK